MIVQATVDQRLLLLRQRKLFCRGLKAIPDVLSQPHPLRYAEALDCLHVDLHHALNLAPVSLTLKRVLFRGNGGPPSPMHGTSIAKAVLRPNDFGFDLRVQHADREP